MKSSKKYLITEIVPSFLFMGKDCEKSLVLFGFSKRKSYDSVLEALKVLDCPMWLPLGVSSSNVRKRFKSFPLDGKSEKMLDNRSCVSVGVTSGAYHNSSYQFLMLMNAAEVLLKKDIISIKTHDKLKDNLLNYVGKLKVSDNEFPNFDFNKREFEERSLSIIREFTEISRWKSDDKGSISLDCSKGRAIKLRDAFIKNGIRSCVESRRHGGHISIKANQLFDVPFERLLGLKESLRVISPNNRPNEVRR